MTTPHPTAVADADALLRLLIEKQPELFKINGSLTEGTGRTAGEFLTALRSQLVKMYEQVPAVR
ncbi:MAG: hypothetical protein JWP52_1410 [Rhizobacter sp.]|jgi:hypothetical protein|nr:hypothetical protein [Rhizobacter sp.]